MRRWEDYEVGKKMESSKVKDEKVGAVFNRDLKWTISFIARRCAARKRDASTSTSHSHKS